MTTHQQPRTELRVYTCSTCLCDIICGCPSPSFSLPFSPSLPPSLPLSVIVEAVKCLCNLVLSSHSLATTCTDLGVLHGLSLRLRLVRNRNLPPDIMTFDLRLLFLITACGVAERYGTMYMYTYIVCMYMYTYIVCMYMYTYIVCMYMYTYIVCMYMYMYVCMYIQLYVHYVCTCMYVCTYVRMYMYV